ncbi:MAG: DUF3551 domain-containing protein [Pseudolabrys sp.]
MKVFTMLAALAALLLWGIALSAVSSADAATGSRPFCRQVDGGTAMYCNYRTMAACVHDAKPAGDQCIQNPHGRRGS